MTMDGRNRPLAQTHTCAVIWPNDIGFFPEDVVAFRGNYFRGQLFFPRPSGFIANKQLQYTNMMKFNANYISCKDN